MDCLEEIGIIGQGGDIMIDIEEAAILAMCREKHDPYVAL